jgi:hypothetical protein
MQKYMMTFSTWIFGFVFAVSVPLAWYAVNCLKTHNLAGLAFCKFMSIAMLVMLGISLALAFFAVWRRR